LRAAAAEHATQQIFQASAGWSAALRVTAGRLAWLLTATEDTAQQVLQTSATGLTGRRCFGPIVLIAATGHAPRIAARDAGLWRRLSIAALGSWLAAELAEKVPESISALLWA
jgi:hypothetical protein